MRALLAGHVLVFDLHGFGVRHLYRGTNRMKQQQKLTVYHQLCQLHTQKLTKLVLNCQLSPCLSNQLNALGRACVGVRPAWLRGAALVSGHEQDETAAKVDNSVPALSIFEYSMKFA